MDFTFYHLLLQNIAEPVDLSLIQSCTPLPEHWPVVLQSIETFRKQMVSFTVTDGHHAVVCKSNLPEVYDHIASLELGTIVHLLGSQPVFNDEKKQYSLNVHAVCTLKAYDDYLKRIQEEEETRVAAQMADFHDLYPEIDPSHPV